MVAGFAVSDRRAMPADLPDPRVASAVASSAIQLPARLQRSRRRGWTMPANAKYCGRPTLQGNPFQTARFGHMKSVNLHRRWLHGCLGALSLERLGYSFAEIDALVRRRGQLLASLPSLARYDFLVCWCALGAPCHVDNLREVLPFYVGADRLAA